MPAKTATKSSSKKPVNKKKPTRFPKKELNTWIKGKTTWDHKEWLDLLADLESQGFGEFTLSPEGRDQIGLYIESKKA